ncbi:hypothetical protein GGI21_002670 [Coemansia aciculifera]|uniref:Uncharacterized protein n=1 Tax=Coemansia aciculifera TaxID=417176 RepID=A0ACC1LZF1_9FUNG|nr:hypothetical protein IWW38_004126 [Coemansia aciculifera]KAJ2908653.1 hypothetical protein GGI21_002670 [Coemansia aciculifera]
MYSTAFALLALCSSSAIAENLITDAATITNTASYTSAVSQQWASVYYQVNQNLNDALFLGKSSDYSTATWLYGTTQLPASYVATWATGYLDRAHELHSMTASGASHTPSSSSSEESESSEESSKHSSAATLGGSLSVLVAAALAVAGSLI